MGTLGGFASPSAPTSRPATPALRAASPNPRPLPATLHPLAALGLARSGGAARGASEGREGRGVVGEVPKHRRSRWAQPGSAYAKRLLSVSVPLPAVDLQ